MLCLHFPPRKLLGFRRESKQASYDKNPRWAGLTATSLGAVAATSRPTPPQIVQIRDDISYEGIANSLLIITTQAELRLSGAGVATSAARWK